MTETSPIKDQPTHKIPIWDLSVRVFHWLLAFGVVVAWATAEFAKELDDFMMVWHMRVGLMMASLIIFRLIWGVVGSQTARFSDFVKSPKSALTHAGHLKRRTPTHHVGHNALGGYSVIALLLFIALQISTGLIADDEIAAQGPLGQFVSRATRGSATEIHHILFNGVMALASLHIAAILFYRFWKHDNLIMPMITGKKDLPENVPAKPMRSGLLGLLILIAIAAAVYSGVNALGPPPPTNFF